MRTATLSALVVSLLFATAGCSSESASDAQSPAPAQEPTSSQSSKVVMGAGFTTFDEALGGCLEGSQKGINCNGYKDKASVYINGGPVAAGLSDGTYFFAVLTPGSQNDGFTDGQKGNLSDTAQGGTAGDNGTGDDVSNRTFTVQGHEIVSYSGTHKMGKAPGGKTVIALAPFDDTDNEAGVYMVALCKEDAVGPRDCKYDAFRLQGGTAPKPPVVSGGKFYDANANSLWDPGEPGIASWPISYTDGVSGIIMTGDGGLFSVEMTPDSYVFSELPIPSSSPWKQTGPYTYDGTPTGAATVVVNQSNAYEITVADGSTVPNVFFGNVCLGAGGGHTLGFWSNKNGKALIDNSTVFPSSSTQSPLSGLNLVDAKGAPFVAKDYASFRSWILSATATNMAYMLSAQLAAMKLNVYTNQVKLSSIVYAPGLDITQWAPGYVSIEELISMGTSALAGLPPGWSDSQYRSWMETIKNALDAANNNTSFVQPSPTSPGCSLPSFVLSTTGG